MADVTPDAARYQFEAPGGATWFGMSAPTARLTAIVIVPAVFLSMQQAFRAAFVWVAVAFIVTVAYRTRIVTRVAHRVLTRTGHRTRSGVGGWRRRHLQAGAQERVRLPAAFARVSIDDQRFDWPGAGTVPVGVVFDAVAGTLSAVLRVTGSGFELLSDRDKDRAVAGWGNSLSPFARDRSPVTQIVWQEWARPVGLDAHHQFLATRTRPSTVERDDYDGLLAERSPWTVAHETLVTLSVSIAKVASRRSVKATGRSGRVAAGGQLVRHLSLFAGRLSMLGLSVSNPLTGPELAFAVRARSDPSRLTQIGRLERSLASAAGHRDIEWGPMSVDPGPRMVQVDGSWHRSWRAAMLPLLPVPADWLGVLLTDAAEVTRTVTVVYRPVPPRKAARDVSRQLTSLETDHEDKQRHGFRLKGRETRKVEAMEERERELAAGFAEFEVAMVVTATASSPELLEVAADQIEDAAGYLDLRPLDHDQLPGFVASAVPGRVGRKNLL